MPNRRKPSQSFIDAHERRVDARARTQTSQFLGEQADARAMPHVLEKRPSFEPWPATDCRNASGEIVLPEASGQRFAHVLGGSRLTLMADAHQRLQDAQLQA